MRRKTGRSGRKLSPERAEPDSPKKSHRHSSRKHKRSSSRSSADSDNVERTNTKEPTEEGTESNVPSDEEKSDNGSKNKPAQSPTRENKHKLSGDSESSDRNSSKRGSSLVKDDNEDSQEQEERAEETEEKKNKGKSKGKNKSNIEKSSNIIEPETENENVQGTPQSPSNDNADNENVVQNVNDTTKANMEEQDDSKNEDKGNDVATNEQQENTDLGINFESEYAQERTNKNNNLDQEKNQQDSLWISQNNAAKHLEQNESNQNESKSSSYDKSQESSSKKRSSSEKGDRSNSRKSSSKKPNEEKSTTPEMKNNQEPNFGSHSRKSESSVHEDHKSRRKSTGESGKEKTEYGESSSSKKKITLRRSPPANKEHERAEKSEDKTPPKEQKSTEDHGKETEKQENKPSKKITLKRPTIEDRTHIEEKVDGKTEGASSRRSSTNEEFGEGKRRLSSLCEDKGQDGEEKSKKVLKKIKLVRSLSRLSNDGDEERTKLLSTERRQKWSKSDWLNKLTSSFYKIDVESIKVVCPSLEFLGENEVNLETTPKERRKSESDFKRKISIDKSDDSDRPDYEKQMSEDSSSEQKIELNPNIIAMNRKISIVDDTASKLRPPPSPAKHPTSDVLFITNLVRPFTVKQLKELLERTGKIKEDGFWTDRIKSKCYVHYESVEEAEATRNALHGVHWPIGNGKKLVIDYAMVEDLEKAKNPAPAPIPVVDKVPEKENREPERSQDKYKDREREEKKRRDGPIREWDLGKENSRRGRSRSRSRSRERARKHSRRSYTPDDYIHKKSRKMEESVPQKLMDDLFLKTKATPSIYWQPLSPEEIATKQKQRLVRMEEHKRRIEETRGRLRDRRGSFRRR